MVILSVAGGSSTLHFCHFQLMSAFARVVATRAWRSSECHSDHRKYVYEAWQFTFGSKNNFKVGAFGIRRWGGTVRCSTTEVRQNNNIAIYRKFYFRI